jgi:tellurite resistance protein
VARQFFGSWLPIVLLIIVAIAALPKEVWIVAVVTVVILILYSLLRSQAKPSATVRTVSVERSPVPARRFSSDKPNVSVTSESCWVPLGKEITILNLTIPGGMLYVGRGLASVAGSGTEPALINPTLPVQIPTGPVERMDYWPSYSSISSVARGGYLQWLAGGRKDPDVQIGYVFLFFYGLERRVLLDSRQYKEVGQELSAIFAEVKRLLSIYGSSGSFHSYANSFLDLELTAGTHDRIYKLPPLPQRQYRFLTLRHKVALGQVAVDGTALPAEWAYSWLINDDRIYLRTPAHRCQAEFKKLFFALYAEKFGEGIQLPVNKTKLKVSYRAASASLGYNNIETSSENLPDVTVLEGPLNKLKQLGELAVAQLEAYSRYLGKNPDKRGSMDALVLLPLQLWPKQTIDSLKTWFNQLGADKSLQVVTFGEITRHFPPLENLTKDRLVALASVLERLGIGMEPDVRWGGPTATADESVVLFPILPDEKEAKPSALYPVAALTLNLAAAVAMADGEVSSAEEEHVEARLASCLPLAPAERVRLHARLKWLLLNPPTMTALKKRVAVLSEEEKQTIIVFLIDVAGISGGVSPEEVKVLTKIYRIFGLEQENLYSRLHAAATEPVTVTPATPGQTRFRLPPKPVAKSTGSVALDGKRIAALKADSEHVSALLGTIFSKEEDIPEPPVPTEPEATPAGRSFAGLDTEYSELVRLLASRDVWSRNELQDLASDRGIMLDGTLEHINEAFLDKYNEPLIEGEDPMEINKDIVKELQTA